MTIKSGIPQESVLRLLLLLLYIDDIQSCSELVSISYSQMTQIFLIVMHICLKTLNEIIQIQMNNISSWLSVNKLSIKIAKTKFVLFVTNTKSLRNVKICPRILRFWELLLMNF